MRWLFEREVPFDRFCQSVLLQVPAALREDDLAAALQTLLDHHDALRMQLAEPSALDGWCLNIPVRGHLDARALLQRVDIAGLDEVQLQACLTEQAQAAECRLVPQQGVMLQAVWFDAAEQSGRLLLVIHHLAVDGVSWRILLPALQQAWQAISTGRTPTLETSSHSFRRWATHLVDNAGSAARQAELPLWTQILAAPDPLLSARPFDPQHDTGHTMQQLSVSLPADATKRLLTDAPARFHGQVNDILLSAFAVAVADWRRRHTDSHVSNVLLDLEGHGRETGGTDIHSAGIDLSRTVGWFTSLFPLRLDLAGIDLDDALRGGHALGRTIKRVKEQLRALPDHGLGYGLLRYLDSDAAPKLAAFSEPQISFNYLGRFPVAQTQDWGIAVEQTGVHGDPAMPPAHPIELNSLTRELPDGAEFVATWSWAGELFTHAQIDDLAGTYMRALQAIVMHLELPQAGGLTPSDLPLVTLEQTQIEALEARYPLRDILPLSPLQKGLLFHALYDTQGPDAYAVQVCFELRGKLDESALQQAAHALLQRHPQLGACFIQHHGAEPVQLLPREVPLDWRWHDLSMLDAQTRTEQATHIVVQDRQTRFDLACPPLLRFTLIRLASDQHQLLLTNHHILLDGWSLPVLTQELFNLYTAARGKPQRLSHPTPYRDYLGWLARRDRDAARRAWSDVLEGLEQPTLLVPAHTGANTAQHNHAWQLPEALTRRLGQQARKLGLTLNSVLQSAWGLLLGHLCGRNDVVFGGTVSGRPPELPDVGRMVGLFINTLPIRLHWQASQMLAEVLQHSQAQQAGLIEHQHLDLAEIQQLADLGPLFDSLYVFENYPIDSHALETALGEISVASFHSHDA
ncbi:MAG TPA: condensation domain-containing protein, partial [Rhodanobacter sp.]|nr:condensation domain-containing protein [Rhodanobacter sp.]